MTRTSHAPSVALVLSVATLLFAIAGCPTTTGPAPIDTGDLGVTAGGMQDIAHARSDIQAGYYPSPDIITVEGFLAEHDIPLTAPENAPEIYAAVGVAWRMPFHESAATSDVFVRLGTTIDVASFRRAPQNLAVVVDRSGSMNDSASSSDHRAKIEAVKEALHSLVNRLDSADQISIVVFSNEAKVWLAPTTTDSADRIHDRIDEIDAKGETNMYDAVTLGFTTLAESADGARVNRLILFTDAEPTVGPTGSAEFLEVQRAYAAEGYGFTLMGVGADFGDELARDISQVRGGNTYYLSNSERIAQIFEQEFDYLVTPAAYDLTLRVQVPQGVGIRAVYGVPDYTPGSAGAEIVIPTLFFSPRTGGGAIVVRLTLAQVPTFEQPVTLGQGTLSYTLANGQHRDLGQPLTLPAGLSPTGDPPYFSDDATRRAAVLLDTANVLHDAAQAARDGRRQDGITLIRTFLDGFSAATAGLSDRTAPTSRGLADERALLESMLGLLQRGGYYYY